MTAAAGGALPATMLGAESSAVFAVTCLGEARAAAAAAPEGAGLVLWMPAPVAALAGVQFLASLRDHIAAETGRAVTGIVDCGERGGDAMAALRLGLGVAFSAASPAAAAVTAAAGALGLPVMESGVGPPLLSQPVATAPPGKKLRKAKL